ncbi:MAG TPA: S8 family serine peptidase [Hyphomicrobiaceae bacterium]|nr:S8 family serine peptidase [Hyphomicrobiaceae bacterium]
MFEPAAPGVPQKRASGLLTVPNQVTLAPATTAPLAPPHKPHWGAVVSKRKDAEPTQSAKPAAGPSPAIAAKASSRTTPRGRAGFASPSLEFAHGVISGVNLSPKALEVAVSKGFTQVGVVTKSAGIVITKLAPPPGYDVMSARALLQAGLPTEGFALGQIYRPYHVVSDDLGLPAVPVGQNHTCSAERCYGTALIKWQAALYECTARIKVGVIDTNIDQMHPAFRGRRLKHGTFLPPGAKRAPDSHGTGVLALLSGNPESSTPGLIPNAEFYVADTFFMDHTGQAITDSNSLVDALEWMNAVNVDVVNLSLVGPRDEHVLAKIREMTARGIVFVAAAGNEGHMAPPSYPAAYKEVIAVTAVDHNLQNYRHANRGNYIDLAAPGVAVWTALPSYKEGAQTGTSFAVPYVTAVVAATLPGTPLKHEHGRFDPLQPKKTILARLVPRAADLGVPGYDTTFGYGLVQAPATCPDAVAPSALNAGPWAGAIQPASWVPR